MIFRPFARSLSPYLTVYLLLVSLGLPLHRVYCACKGESQLQWVVAEHVCGHDEKKEDFIESSSVEAAVLNAKTSCCKSEEKSCESPTSDPHDCGRHEVVLAKMTASFLASEMKWTGDHFGPSLPPQFVAESTIPSPLLTASSPPIRGPNESPPPYGRQLLVLQQVFLC